MGGIGVGMLILGAEVLVRGAVSLARRIGISSLVAGLTIVSVGTLMPEMSVNLYSSFKGVPDIAIGNVIGSNIGNILFVLGIAAATHAIRVKRGPIRREMPFSLLALFVLGVMGNDAWFVPGRANVISQNDGIVLLVLCGVFLYYLYALSKGERQELELPEHAAPKLYSVLYIAAGVVCLFYGGRIVVDNAILFARVVGVSEAFIGLTIVALGTSLPELATAIVAAYRREPEIAIGNIIGSNTLNVFLVLGVTASVSPIPYDNTMNADLMIGITAVALLFLTLLHGRKSVIERSEGGAFIALYAGYLIYLFVRG